MDVVVKRAGSFTTTSPSTRLRGQPSSGSGDARNSSAVIRSATGTALIVVFLCIDAHHQARRESLRIRARGRFSTRQGGRRQRNNLNPDRVLLL